MGRDRIIETYVQRLLAWEEPMTADRLSALAQEVGLGPDDIAAVQQKAQDHFDLGRNYLEFDCLDEAIEELTQAKVLDPLNFDIIQTLAYAYDQRYGKRKDPSDKQKAITLANQCLGNNPDNKNSVMLISALEHDVNHRQRLLWVGLAVLLTIGIAKPVIDTITRRAEVEQLTQDAILETPEQTLDSPADNNSTAIPPVSSDTTVGINIPVTFEQPGLTLEPRLSQLDNYDEASYYTLQGALFNESAQEISALLLDIEYLDQDGTVIETDSKDVIDSSHATVRPGDHHAIDLIQKVTPALATVRLSVNTIDETLAPFDGYAPDTPIAYDWEISPPDQLSFELTARSEETNTYDITDNAYFSAEWAITNTGDRPIRKLKLQINFYNTLGELILSKDVLAVYGSDTAMLPDEVRAVRVIKSLDKDYDRYQVTVLEAD